MFKRKTMPTQHSKRHRGYLAAEQEAATTFPALLQNPLFIAGLALYWGEGDKVSKYNIRIANTDPDVIRIFRCFLEEILSIPRTRVKSWLLLYPDLNEKDCKQFWVQESGLLPENFNKSIVIRGKGTSKPLSNGVCYTGISSILIKKKMLVWLHLLGSLR
jgi:hypothetical protein